MNAHLRIGGQLVGFDYEATQKLYATNLRKAGADECGCCYCKNFAAQRDTAYPSQFRDLLSRIGADPTKELEAFDYDFGVEKSTALYGGWFVFVGEILEGKGWRPPTIEEQFSYWFTNSFPTGGLPTFGKIVAVEFITEIPWVIADPRESHVRR